MSPRRKIFIAVAVAVTLALGAAVVQGAFFAGSQSAAPNRAITHGTGAFGPLQAPSPTGPKGPNGARGAAGAERGDRP